MLDIAPAGGRVGVLLAGLGAVSTTFIAGVEAIKLAMAERGFGSEMVRAPRLPLEGQERDTIVQLIRSGIKTRPGK